MANKKKNNFNSKKKTTTKKNSTQASKTTSAKKKTTTSAKKVTPAGNKNTNSKTKTTSATKKKNTSSKNNIPKKKTTKTTVKKENIKLVTEEPIKIENDADKTTKIVLPKLKSQTREISENSNEPEQVIKTEDYTVIKKKPIRFEGKEKKSTNKAKKVSTISNAKKVENAKHNYFIKKINRLKRKAKMYGITSVIPLGYIITFCVILALLIFTPIALNQFGKTSKIDINAIPEKIDQLKTVSFNLDNVSDIISSSEAFTSLKDYYEYDFKEVFDLNPNYVDEYVIKYNKSKKQVFIAIKALNNHHDDIKNSIDKFLKDNDVKDYEYLEYQGYQIYIKSSNDAIVISKIKQSQMRVFNILQDLKKDDIYELLKVSDADYDEALVKIAMLRSDTCGYAIFKPKNASSKEKIKNLMNDYYNGLEAKWQNNEDNKKLVQNRHFEEYQGYLIYIVSRDNDLVVQLLKS